MCKHVLFDHTFYVYAQQVPDFVLVVIESVGDFHLELPFLKSIVEHQDAAIMLFSLIVYLAIF